MRKLLVVLIFVLVVLFGIRYCNDRSDEIVLKENSALLQEQIKNVGKLIVTEGHFSQVFDYKNSKAIFGSLINVEKKALVVVNAEVTVSYDLSEIEYEIDAENKNLEIKYIPEEEIKIYPDFEYYDVTADYLNPFDADDYNDIKETVKKSLLKKVETSSLKSNAKNRLISELAKFYILTNSMGWTLTYKGNTIAKEMELQSIQL